MPNRRRIALVFVAAITLSPSLGLCASVSPAIVAKGPTATVVVGTTTTTVASTSIGTSYTVQIPPPSGTLTIQSTGNTDPYIGFNLDFTNPVTALNPLGSSVFVEFEFAIPISPTTYPNGGYEFSELHLNLSGASPALQAMSNASTQSSSIIEGILSNSAGSPPPPATFFPNNLQTFSSAGSDSSSSLAFVAPIQDYNTLELFVGFDLSAGASVEMYGGVAVNDVSLSSVPEPSAFAAMITGLMTVSAFGWLSQRKMQFVTARAN